MLAVAKNTAAADIDATTLRVQEVVATSCLSASQRDHGINAMLTTFALAYPVLLKRSFSLLDCTQRQPCDLEIQACPYYLDIAPSTLCYIVQQGSSRWALWNLQGDNLFYILYAGFMSFVYVIVIPSMIFVVLWRARRSDEGFDSIERRRYGWFLMRFDETHWYYEFVVLAKKVFAVGIGVFLNDTSTCTKAVCQDGSSLPEGTTMCPDGTDQVPPVVNHGFCPDGSPPGSFVKSMSLLCIMLVVQLAMQWRLSPLKTPPFAPEGTRRGPADYVELCCIASELLLLAVGVLQFFVGSSTGLGSALNIFVAVICLLTLVGPVIFGAHCEKRHRDWFEPPQDDGGDGAPNKTFGISSAEGAAKTEVVENPVNT